MVASPTMVGPWAYNTGLDTANIQGKDTWSAFFVKRNIAVLGVMCCPQLVTHLVKVNNTLPGLPRHWGNLVCAASQVLRAIAEPHTGLGRFFVPMSTTI
jgi:hypothetical protein